MTKDTIFIASCSQDIATWGPVAEKLHANSYDTIIYEADKVALGSVAMSVQVSNAGDFELVYDHTRVYVHDIGSAWYRRASFFSSQDDDVLSQISLDAERRAIQASIWDAIPNARWLNAPNIMSQAEHKLTQLRIAGELGFSVPKTIVSNSWSDIEAQLDKEIIFKPSYGLFYRADDPVQVFTTRLINSHDTLPVTDNPFPGIWQNYTSKRKEWRVTAVGDEIFAAAIYTQNDAKDDWRKHQTSTGVEFAAEQFDDDLGQKCVAYLGRMGLQFGAFDFIETPDGETVFLECNPNGQYGWLEQGLNLPISNSIARVLQRTAQG